MHAHRALKELSSEMEMLQKVYIGLDADVEYAFEETFEYMTEQRDRCLDHWRTMNWDLPCDEVQLVEWQRALLEWNEGGREWLIKEMKKIDNW